jgi:hypothetical protein
MRDEKLFLEKKEKLEFWINKLGLTKNIFAERVYWYMNDNGTNEEMESSRRKFIKALQRETTKLELLDSYLDILYELPEFEKLGFIKPKNYFKDDFNDNFNQRMKKISRKLTEEITYNDSLNI